MLEAQQIGVAVLGVAGVKWALEDTRDWVWVLLWGGVSGYGRRTVPAPVTGHSFPEPAVGWAWAGCWGATVNRAGGFLPSQSLTF